jgi:hypothetical protein
VIVLPFWCRSHSLWQECVGRFYFELWFVQKFWSPDVIRLRLFRDYLLNFIKSFQSFLWCLIPIVILILINNCGMIWIIRVNSWLWIRFLIWFYLIFNFYKILLKEEEGVRWLFNEWVYD